MHNTDMTPFDMSQKPCKQYFFLMPLVWGASFLLTRQFKLKIRKEGMKGLKPPYLVIATHQGPVDYYIAPLALFPRRANYVSDMEGFAVFGKWLYRGLGCIGKRRFVSDISVVRNMKYAIKMGQSVVVYPESRHSNVGTTAYIAKNMGRLCKSMNVPVVILSVKGGYLANPFWDELHTRTVPIEAELKCVYTKETLAAATEEEIQRTVENGLKYDEYKYQRDNKIMIKDRKRAEGLHKALYRCRSCGEKYRMKSRGALLECEACGASYELREDGYLVNNTDKEELIIPDWYEWERKLAEEECFRQTDEGSVFNRRSFDVSIEALPNEKGFVSLGRGKLELHEKEFLLTYGDTVLHFPHNIRESVQTEYDYRGKSGECIVLSTKECCYYLYPGSPGFNPTELQFIGEFLYSLHFSPPVCYNPPTEEF